MFGILHNDQEGAVVPEIGDNVKNVFAAASERVDGSGVVIKRAVEVTPS